MIPGKVYGWLKLKIFCLEFKFKSSTILSEKSEKMLVYYSLKLVFFSITLFCNWKLWFWWWSFLQLVIFKLIFLFQMINFLKDNEKKNERVYKLKPKHFSSWSRPMRVLSDVPVSRNWYKLCKNYTKVHICKI